MDRKDAEAKFDRITQNPNYCSYARSRAVEALIADRPAFYRLTDHNHAVAGLLTDMANNVGLEAALARYADERRAGCKARELLDLIVPLNTEGHVALGAMLNALDDRDATFRDAAE